MSRTSPTVNGSAPGSAGADPWEQLYDVDFRSLASGSDTDLGIANGAKSIGGKTWTLATKAGMLDTGAGAPSGLYLGGGATEGLRFGLGTTSSTGDHDDAEAGTPNGPVLYATLQALLGATEAPSTTAAATMAAWNGAAFADRCNSLAFGIVVDASALNANRMQAGITIAATNGFTSGVQFAQTYTTIRNACVGREAATYPAIAEVALGTSGGFGLGLGGTGHVAIVVVVHQSHAQVWYADASDGYAYPSTGWRQLTYMNTSWNAVGSATMFNGSSVVGLYVANSSGGGGGTEIDFKRLTIWRPAQMAPVFEQETGAMQVSTL